MTLSVASLISVSTETGGISIALNYSDFLNRIAAALETSAANSTIIANNSSKLAASLIEISSSTRIIAEATTNLSSISTAVDKLSSSSNIISQVLQQISSATNLFMTLSTSTGIRTESPYDWTRPTEIYSWYNQNQTTLVESTETIETLVYNITTITNNVPKFI